MPTTTKSVGQVTIYRVARTTAERKLADANGLVPETVKISVDSVAPARDAMACLISNRNSPIPKGTSLIGVSVDDATGIATVDFSKEFVSNFSGGDTQEAEIINSVRATMGQFGNVKTVQFHVAGAKIDQLGGTESLTDPLPVIRPGEMATAVKS